MKKTASFVSIFLTVVTFLSCHISRAQTPSGTVPQQPVDPTAYDHPIRVACAGDSITMGVGTLNPAVESYPAQLQSVLGPKWAVTNFGVGGRTLLRKADPFAMGRPLASKPDVVIIMLGTNDSRQKTWDKFGGDFVGDYEAIIDQVAHLDTHPGIWICCPPPMFPGRWDLSEEILTSKVIPAIKQIARDKNVPLIDFHTALLDQKANFADTVHPNAKVAHLMAELVATTLSGTTHP